MAEEARDEHPLADLGEGLPGVLRLAGFRYWTASLLPAIVGTTLPFWLRPPGFSFRWLGALEFLIATILFHAGFSFLQAWFGDSAPAGWPRSRLLGAAGACIVAACLLGLHLNSSVPGTIFMVYGLSVIVTGMLYVAPPFSFCRRVGGEVVICEGLGLLPVLGAYLVQAGDLTRTVYLAALPLVVATALWVWTDEIITGRDDEKTGRRTMVLLFGPRFSGRLGVLALLGLFYATLVLAVYRGAMSPLAVVAVLSLVVVRTIVAVSWKHYASPPRMLRARRSAFTLHLAAGIVIAASSLAALCG